MKEQVFQDLANAVSAQATKIDLVANKMDQLDIHKIANHTPREYMQNIVTDDFDVQLDYLPKSDTETIASLEHTIKSLEILNFRISELVDAPTDYSAVVILKRSTETETLEDLIVNSSVDYSGTKIHLMNPELDISTYDIIHLFLFFDGFSYCCLAAGYIND